MTEKAARQKDLSFADKDVSTRITTSIKPEIKDEKKIISLMKPLKRR